MARKKEIDEWAFDYWLLQQYAKLCFKIYYRKIEFVNKNKIPADGSVIIAPNHQNALMDAMVFVCNTPLQIVFLARADIFKGKKLSNFLNYLNIMPIYRIRDGIENVKKNDEVFEKTTRVLHNRNNPLIIFPEGNHGDKRRLRPLVKGIFRIAFQAQEKFGNQKGVKILPVGIDYGHYQNFRSTLLVNVGNPIEVNEFFDTYVNNPVLAINQLRDKYAESLSELMIDIQTEEFYELYMDLRELYNDRMKNILNISRKSLFDKFKADKIMINILNNELEVNPHNLNKLKNLVTDYKTELKQRKLRDWVLKPKAIRLPDVIISVIIKIILAPVFLFGFLHNWLPYWFTASKIKNIKDTQFHSSFKYVVGMIVFPVWYILIALILIFTNIPFWIILLYILVIPFMGLAAFKYYIGTKKLLSRLKFMVTKGTSEVQNLINKRKAIIELMSEIISNHKPYENSR